jgi:hypothetical protein
MADLNPAVKEIVAELAANGAPELNTLSVSRARDQFSDFLDEYLPDESRPPEESLSIAGPNGPITLSVTRPSGALSAPVIL